MSKRTNYITWSEYFMSIAKLSAQRSKDPSTQVGACIVTNNNKIVGIGYNGFPNGCSDDILPWKKEGARLDTKYMYVVHAEVNAIINHSGSLSTLKGCTMYVTLFPCNECAKLIIQSGIIHIIYESDKYHDTDESIAARKLFNIANIKYTKY